MRKIRSVEEIVNEEYLMYKLRAVFSFDDNIEVLENHIEEDLIKNTEVFIEKGKYYLENYDVDREKVIILSLVEVFEGFFYEMQKTNNYIFSIEDLDLVTLAEIIFETFRLTFNELITKIKENERMKERIKRMIIQKKI